MKRWVRSLFGGRSPKRGRASVSERRRHKRGRVEDGEVTLHWKDESGEHQMPLVRVLDQSDNGLSVLSEKPFRPGCEVWVSDSTALHRTSVRHCEEMGYHYVLGLYRFSWEHRRFPRALVSGSATLHWAGVSGESHSTQVEVLNVSDEGLQIASPEAVPPESVVQVTGRFIQCLGTTWYCRKSAKRYLIGIQITGAPYAKDAAEYVGD